MATPTIDLLSNEQPSIYYVLRGVAIFHSEGSPQGVVAANKGSLALDTTTGDIYHKTTDTANTGWLPLAGGGAGNPSPPDLSVQFNDGSVFMGDATFTYDPITQTLSVVNIVATNTTTDTLTVNTSITVPTIQISGLAADSVVVTDGSKNLATDAELTYDAALNILTLNGELVVTTITNSGTTTTPDLTLSSFSDGSVLFTDNVSKVSENNSKLRFDRTTHQLSVGGNIQTDFDLISGVPNASSGVIDLFASGNGHQTSLKSADAPDANVTIKLPDNNNAATAGQALVVDTNAAGVLQSKWASVAGGTFSGARLLRTGSQPINSGSDTALIWTTEVYDTDNYFSGGANTRFTIPTTGKYLVTANVAFASDPTGFRLCFFFLNGSLAVVTSMVAAVTGNETGLCISTVFDLTAADFVEFFVHQNSGGALGTSVLISNSTFTITRLG